MCIYKISLTFSNPVVIKTHYCIFMDCVRLDTAHGIFSKQNNIYIQIHIILIINNNNIIIMKYVCLFLKSMIFV